MLAEAVAPPEEEATDRAATAQEGTGAGEPPGEPPTAEATAGPGPPYWATLTTGRVLHYVLGGHCRPAMVVKLGEEPGTCNLRVFTDPEDGALFGGALLFREAVSPDATGRAEGTWHWPERAG